MISSRLLIFSTLICHWNYKRKVVGKTALSSMPMKLMQRKLSACLVIGLKNGLRSMNRLFRSRAVICTIFIIRMRSEEHTSELQSRFDIVCRLLLEKKKLYENKYNRKRNE